MVDTDLTSILPSINSLVSSLYNLPENWINVKGFILGGIFIR